MSVLHSSCWYLARDGPEDFYELSSGARFGKVLKVRHAAEDDAVNAAANRRIRRRAPQITLK
ncbi:MAG TPA: hypothetical protein VER34_07340 [Mycobacterium sp.]|nr:hypothetical protein [Mycobacterium sp.]